MAVQVISKTYLYKISRDGVDLGLLPDVVSQFEFTQNINTAGVQVTIKVGLTPDEPENTDVALIGDSQSLIQNSNDIAIVEVSADNPAGKTVFTGFISRWTANYGGSDDIEITAISYGDDLDNFIISTGDALEQSQATQDASYDFGAGAGTYKSFIQSYQTGVGIANLASVDLTLRRVLANAAGGDVIVSVHTTENDAKNNVSSIGSATNASVQSDTTDAAAVFNFSFASPLTVTASTTYYIRVGVTADVANESVAPYQIFYKNSNAYANGALSTESRGGSNTGFKTPTTTPSPGSSNDWSFPTNGYVEDSAFAVATQANKYQSYGTFGFGLPSNVSAVGIEAVLKGKIDSGSNKQIRTALYPFGVQKNQVMTTTNTSYTLGGATNTWGITDLALSNFSDANFYARAHSYTTGADIVWYIDGIKIKIYYSTWAGTATDLYFRTYSSGGGAIAPYIADDPTDILKDVIDDYASQGGSVNYDGSSTDNTGLSVDYTFNVNTTLEGVKKVLDLAPYDWYWYVDPATQIIYFQQTAVTATHTLVRQRHFVYLSLEATTENIRNVVYITGGEVNGDRLAASYSNPDSIAATGHQYLERISDLNIVDTPTATAISNSFLDGRAAETYQTPLRISAGTYDLTLFKPGDTVGFANFGNFIDDLILQIVSVHQHPDYAELTLGQLPKKIVTTLDGIRRDVIQLQTNPIDNNLSGDISSVGNVTTINPASVLGAMMGTPVAFYGTTVQSYTDASNADVTSYTEVFDYGGNFASGVFTAPYTGVYHFDVVMSFTDVPVDGRIDTNMQVNSVAIAHGHGVSRATNFDPAANFSITLNLTASDAVKVNISNNAGATEALVTSSFSGFLVGRTA